MRVALAICHVDGLMHARVASDRAAFRCPKIMSSGALDSMHTQIAYQCRLHGAKCDLQQQWRRFFSFSHQFWPLQSLHVHCQQVCDLELQYVSAMTSCGMY